MKTAKQLKKNINRIMQAFLENDIKLEGFLFNEKGRELYQKMKEDGVLDVIIKDEVEEAAQLWKTVKVKNEDDLHQIQNNFAHVIGQINSQHFANEAGSDLVSLGRLLPIPDPFELLTAALSHSIMVDIFNRPVENGENISDKKAEKRQNKCNRILDELRKEYRKEKKVRKRAKKQRKEIRELSKLFGEN